ncbi:unnamed protein product [Ectocarpus fasciculatus]
MRVFASALALWAVGVANGISSCLDPDHESYQCASGTEIIYLTGDYCGVRLTAADMDDVASCFDNAGRTSVTQITMASNNFESGTLPAGLFDGFDNLEILILRANNIYTLPAGLFDGLDSLFYLSVTSDYFALLPAGLFDDLDGLKILYLTGNYLSTLPAGIFDGLGALEELSLRNNQLYTLRWDVFNDLESLTRLYLDENDDLLCVPLLDSSMQPDLEEDHIFVPDDFDHNVKCVCPSAGDSGACASDELCISGDNGYHCTT